MGPVHMMAARVIRQRPSQGEDATAQQTQMKKDISGLRIWYQDGITPGHYTAQAIVQQFPVPVGIIWFSFSHRGDVQLDNIFVHEPYRRNGIAKRLHDDLRKQYADSAFVTGHSTPSGKKLMAALGYKRMPEFGWEMAAAKPKKIKKKK